MKKIAFCLLVLCPAAPSHAMGEADFIRSLASIRIGEPRPLPSLGEATAALSRATTELAKAEFAMARAVLDDRWPSAELPAFLALREAYGKKAAEAYAAGERAGAKAYLAKLEAFDSGMREFVSLVLGLMRDAKEGRLGSPLERAAKGLMLRTKAEEVNGLFAELAALSEGVTPAGGT